MNTALLVFIALCALWLIRRDYMTSKLRFPYYVKRTLWR